MSAPWSPISWKDKPIAQVSNGIWYGIILMDYRTWNTLTKDTLQSQRSPSSHQCSSSDIRQRTRGTASPCYAFRGELVREVHGSPLNLHNPSLQIERLRHQLGPPCWGLCRELRGMHGREFVLHGRFPLITTFPSLLRAKANSNRRKTSPRKSDSSSPSLLSLSGAPVYLLCA